MKAVSKLEGVFVNYIKLPEHFKDHLRETDWEYVRNDSYSYYWFPDSIFVTDDSEQGWHVIEGEDHDLDVLRERAFYEYCVQGGMCPTEDKVLIWYCW